MDTDLTERLDRSIAAPPDHTDPLAALLAEGRRAVRRRRLRSLAGSAAAVLVVAGGVAVATSGAPEPQRPDVSTTPTATVGDLGPEPGETAPPTADLVALTSPRLPAEFRDGRLVLDPDQDFRVLALLDDPWELHRPERSAALAIRFRDHTWWVAVYGARLGGGGAKAVWAGDTGGLDFEGWVASQEASMVPAFTPVDSSGTATPLAQYDEDGALVLSPGVRETDRIDNPFDVPPPAHSVGLSLVGLDGTTWWVALYWSGHGTSYASTPASAARSNFPIWISQQGDLVTTVEHQAGGRR